MTTKQTDKCYTLRNVIGTDRESTSTKHITNVKPTDHVCEIICINPLTTDRQTNMSD